MPTGAQWLGGAIVIGAVLFSSLSWESLNLSPLNRQLSEGYPVNYSFRIRFNRSPTDTIELNVHELEIQLPNNLGMLRLRAQGENLTIRDSDKLTVVAENYGSIDEAKIAGGAMQNALMVALARIRVGADFGYRAPSSVITEYGLQHFEKNTGQRILNNVHGLMIFETNPPPKFALATAKMRRGVQSEKFIQALVDAVSYQVQISQRDLLAYSLFNASFFQPTADTRFLLLVMAIEALIEPSPRSPQALEHIESMIGQTKNSKLTRDEKNSILGSLSWLRAESISQSGKKLVIQRLGNKIYNGKPAGDFFSDCYQLRSRFVHGVLPIPTFEEIGAASGLLEVFVSDLLTTPIFGSSE